MLLRFYPVNKKDRHGTIFKKIGQTAAARAPLFEKGLRSAGTG